MSNAIIRALQRELESVEAKLEINNKQAEHLRGTIAYYTSFQNNPELHPSTSDQLKNHIEVVLDIQRVPLHPRRILQVLWEQSINVPGEDPTQNLRSHMSGDKLNRFYPVGDGTWALSKWAREPEPAEDEADNDSVQPTQTNQPSLLDCQQNNLNEEISIVEDPNTVENRQPATVDNAGRSEAVETQIPDYAAQP